ncbi:MAG: hypothetical protein IKQ04_07005 [Oscillospiraceae bacterium]|nr:hypothetical protein [Oscillospiraceae bacterium]
MKKVLKFCMRFVFVLVILALLAAPLYLIHRISADEIKSYNTPEQLVFVDASFGVPVLAAREDVAEKIHVSGVFVPVESYDMELKGWGLDQIRWSVDPGAEVTEGQVLGLLRDSEIQSPVNGIVVSLNNYGSKPYVRFRLVEPIQLECHVDQQTLEDLRASEALSTKAGETVRLESVSITRDLEGLTTVRLSIDSERYVCGQGVSELELNTGVVFQKTLVLPVSCVYQKTPGEEEPWYAREVTKDGALVGEIEVKPGYTDGKKICVTGAVEGHYYDSGYGSFTTTGGGQ